MCLAKFWESHEEGKKEAIREKAHVQLCALLSDPVPEVRAAAVYALGTFISRTSQAQNTEQRTIIDLNLGLTFAVVTGDASPLVRKELVIALGALVSAYEDKFKQIEMKWIKLEFTKTPPNSGKCTFEFPILIQTTDRPSLKDELVDKSDGKELPAEKEGESETEEEDDAIYEYLWKLVTSMANDPYPLFSVMTSKVINRIRTEVSLSLFHAFTLLGAIRAFQSKRKARPSRHTIGGYELSFSKQESQNGLHTSHHSYKCCNWKPGYNTNLCVPSGTRRFALYVVRMELQVFFSAHFVPRRRRRNRTRVLRTQMPTPAKYGSG